MNGQLILTDEEREFLSLSSKEYYSTEELERYLELSEKHLELEVMIMTAKKPKVRYACIHSQSRKIICFSEPLQAMQYALDSPDWYYVEFVGETHLLTGKPL